MRRVVEFCIKYDSPFSITHFSNIKLVYLEIGGFRLTHLIRSKIQPEFYLFWIDFPHNYMVVSYKSSKCYILLKPVANVFFLCIITSFTPD